MEQRIIAKTILSSWIQLAEMHHMDTSSIIKRLNISDKDSIITFKQFALFAEWVMQNPRGEHFGLRLGKQSNLAALGIVGQLILSSRTISEALEQAAQFFNLISNVLRLDFKTSNDHMLLTFEIDNQSYDLFPKVCQQLLITSMVFTYKEIYFLALQDLHPIKIEMTYPPNNQKALTNLFNCDIQWNSQQNKMTFDKSVLDRKITFSDYELMLHLEKLACKRLTKQKEHLNSFSNSIKLIVYNLLSPSFPDLETVSSQLNMSKRSVQRKLKKEQTSYSILILEMKKSIAQDYLKDNLSIKEVAYLLGYSESSAFINAFKGWFGESPTNYKTRFFSK